MSDKFVRHLSEGLVEILSDRLLFLSDVGQNFQ